MASTDSDVSEAILFVKQNRISREMLYSEFEAVLDHFVPIPDLADQESQAVYLRVNKKLSITAAVFFEVKFDGDGHPDKRWNVPLQQFADTSGRGPDLGAGPIRLACYSQCSIAWHQQNLWDPDMKPGSNTFVLLKKAIKANRLGLAFEEDVPDPRASAQAASPKALNAQQSKEIEDRVGQRLRRQFKQEFRDHMARQLKEQRLRILTLNSQRKQELQQLQLKHQSRIQEYRKHIEHQQHEIDTLQKRNHELKETIDGQGTKIEGLREYFEHKLRNAKTGEGEQLQALKNNFDMELETKIEAATLELKEQLQLREIELMYRSEQEASLQEEIRRLRDENQVLLGNSSEQLLTKLEAAGLNFVAYHPGAGHLTIPLVDMSQYLDDPTAYAAEKCGVSVSQYKDWLNHYRDPTCQAITSGGKSCGEMIERVPTPGQFHVGENDRCDQHKTTPTQTFAAVR